MAYKTTYPYTDEVLHEFPNATDAQVEATLAKAHALYKKWRKEGLAKRQATLHKVADLLRADKDKYAEIMTKDMGKLFTEAQGEVALCADIADYYADKAEEFMKPTPLETQAGTAYYLKQATGVIRWNHGTSPSTKLCGSLPLTLWSVTQWF